MDVRQVDMVINVGALKRRRLFSRARHSCGCRVAHEYGVTCQSDHWTALLTDDEKARLSGARSAGADFVKTSTGFSKGGATVANALMRR